MSDFTPDYCIIVSTKDDPRKKTSLAKTLAKRRQVLMAITAKVEMLRMDLDIVKREYDVRIGKLYLKDDQLDLEIIRYHRLKTMMEEGLSFDQALKEFNETYEAERDIFTMKFDEIADEEIMIAKRKHIPMDQELDIKSLWKKLLFQLHPDLTSDTDEKVKREKIMRKINIAYAQNDYETLKNIENQHYVQDPDKTTLESLEKTLENIENAIMQKQVEYRTLRESEWFMWKKKGESAKRKKIDLFKDLEEKLLNDIARKIKIVQKLRDEFYKKGYY